MNVRNLFWFSFFCFCLWCAAALTYFCVGGFYTDVPGLLFTVFFIPGQLSLFMAGLFFLSFVWCPAGPRALFWAAVFWGSFWTLFFVLDIFVFTQYRFHISMAMLELFFGPAGSDIFVFPTVMYVMLGVGVVMLCAAVTGVAVLARKVMWGQKAVIGIIAALVLAFAGYNGLHAWGKFMQAPSVLGQVAYLPWAYPMSANRRLRQLGFEPKQQPYSIPSAGTLNYPLAPLLCDNKDKPNILLIMLDSWRIDSITPQTMPHTYAQSKNAFYFKDHLAGGNATEASVFSLFYSLPYAYWNALSGRGVPPVFISRLQEDGYQLGIFSSAHLNSPEFHRNVFVSIPNLRLASAGNTSVERDLSLQKDFAEFIKQRDKNKPFFGFLFYDATHDQAYPQDGKIFVPSVSKINYLMLTKNTDPTPYINKYKNSVYFVDGLLGQTFSLLKETGLDKNTIVILTGDHGQELNDTHNNFWGHNSNFAKWQTHVPLLIWWPGKHGKEIEYRTSHYDIVPTLMQQALACSNALGDYSVGQNLFDGSPRQFTIISNYTKKAVQEGDNISVIDNYGYLENYDEDYQKTKTGVSPQAFSAALKTFSKFYK